VTVGRATIEYMAFQGVEDFEIRLVDDFVGGLEWIRGKDNAFLVQCSARPRVHEVTEAPLGLGVRRRHVHLSDEGPGGAEPPRGGAPQVSRPRSRDCGLHRPRRLGGDHRCPVGAAYSRRTFWRAATRRASPASSTSPTHPGELRLVEEIGEIDTTWVVYGTRKRFQGEVIGIPSADLFHIPLSV
jgi:hypothetical protein